MKRGILSPSCREGAGVNILSPSLKVDIARTRLYFDAPLDVCSLRENRARGSADGILFLGSTRQSVRVVFLPETRGEPRDEPALILETLNKTWLNKQARNS